MKVGDREILPLGRLSQVEVEALRLVARAQCLIYNGLSLRPLIDALWEKHHMAELRDASYGAKIRVLTRESQDYAD